MLNFINRTEVIVQLFLNQKLASEVFQQNQNAPIEIFSFQCYYWIEQKGCKTNNLK